MQPLVRVATAEDVPALVALRAEMFRTMGSDPDADPDWEQGATRWFTERIDDARFRFAVVEVAGQVVSCAIGFRRDTPPSPGNPTGGDVHVNNVSTTAQARGKGYASLALADVMQWARASGVRRAELMATAEGQGLYEREGFAVHEYPAMRARLGEPR